MSGEARTHLAIEPRWSGEVVEIGDGTARVRLATLPEMAADEHGLVHGGFVFSLADYAAMLAVNEPNVVLASAEVEFLGPVRVGETVEASAEVVGAGERSRRVEVLVRRGPREVARGEFRCVVPRRHVLETGATSTDAGPERR